jgi:predicted permease
MDPAAARAEAQRRFGDRARVEAEMRRIERDKARRASRRAAFRDLGGDLTYAARSLVRQPLFAISAILTLGLSIGVNTAIFSAVNSLLLKPLAVRDPGSLVVVALAQKRDNLVSNVSYPLYREVVKLEAVFDDAVAWTGWEVAVRTGDDAERAFLLAGSGNYLTALGVTPMLGRIFTPVDAADRANVLVINHGYWERRFQRDPAVIGRVVHLNEVPFTIIGVLPPGFVGTQPLVLPDAMTTVDALSLIEPSMSRRVDDMGWGAFRVLARLRPGVSLAQARLAVGVLGDELARQHPAEFADMQLVMEREIRTRPEYTVSRLTPWIAGVFFALVGLALLVACANVANLLLVRATARRSEIAVRSALGAAPSRVIRLLLAESLLLGAASLVVAYLLARFCIGWLNTLDLAVDVPITFGLVIDWRVFTYAGVISLGAGVIAGLAPALFGARTPVSDVLREGGRTGTAGRSRARLRGALVVSQVAVSFVLLVCGALFIRSARSAAGLDLGFRRERTLLAQTDLSLHRIDSAQARVVQDRMLERLGAVPGIEQVGLGSHVPLQGNYSGRTVWVDTRPAAAPEGYTSAGTASVSHGYVQALGLRLLAGRDFTAQDDTAAPPVAIVNRALADALWPGAEAVGQRVRLEQDGRPVEVVGVVGSAQYILLGEQPRPFIYLPLRQHPTRGTFIVIRTRSAEASGVAGDVRRVVQDINPAILVYGLRTMAAHLDQGIALFFVNMAATLATAIGLLGLLQTIVGLYGVLSYSVAQRSREIGIRMALGARGGDVIRGVLRQGSVLVAAGLVIGGGLALTLTRMMGALLYGVSPTDGLAFGGSLLVVGALALVSSYIPAWRASRLAPAAVIRAE